MATQGSGGGEDGGKASPGAFAGLRTVLDGASAEAHAGRMLAPGEIFARRYRIEEMIGEGGAGFIYRAVDTSTDDAIALKLIRPDRAPGADARKRLIREAMVARGVRHPNVVAVHDASIDGEQAYVVMELLSGRTLRGWLLQQGAAGHECSFAVARAIVAAIADGLDAAHAQGVVHRDLKPENVFLLQEPTAEGARLKLLDFGLARTGGPQVGAAAALGTPHYMAPEQITAPDTVKPSADIYSLCVMFYELLVGVLPAGHWQAPSRGRDDVPDTIDRLIEAGLSNRARLRPQSAAEFRSAVAAAFAPAKPPPPPAEPAVPPPKPVVPPAAAPPAAGASPAAGSAPAQPAPALDVAAALKRARTLTDNGKAHEAHDLFRQAALTGDPRGKVAYGRFLREGPRDRNEEYAAMARTWFESAAKDGSGEAMAALGTLDRYGFGGPKNPQSSIAWYIKAGEAGNPEGDLMAGFAYRATLRDWGGVPDYPKARYYLERAAAKGNEIAMLHLGEMLAEGQGGPVDRSAAKAWLERAEKAGYTSAGDKLKAYQLR